MNKSYALDFFYYFLQFTALWYPMIFLKGVLQNYFDKIENGHFINVHFSFSSSILFHFF